MFEDRATGCRARGLARPADDFRGIHGPDPESCGRARSTREVAHLLRRRTSLETCALAETCPACQPTVVVTSLRLVTFSRPSVEAVRRNKKCIGTLGTAVKAARAAMYCYTMPLRHARARVDAKLRFARIATARARSEASEFCYGRGACALGRLHSEGWWLITQPFPFKQACTLRYELLSRLLCSSERAWGEGATLYLFTQGFICRIALIKL